MRWLSGIFSGIRNWLRSHASNFVAAARRLLHEPLATLLSVAVIAIALALPAGLDLLVKNGRNFAGDWESARDFSVYLQPGEPLDVAVALARELEAQDIITKVTLISADDALTAFQASSGLGDVLQGLKGNPLPHSLVVTPTDTAAAEALDALASRLRERPDVDSVQIDTLWVQRLNAILVFLQRLVAITAALLIVAVIIIIGNTIRLDIQNRRDEIEIMKLLGAGDAFVRRPFLYVGFWYGLGGGLTALLLLAAAGQILSAPVQDLLQLYGSNQPLVGIDAGIALAVAGGGIAAGWAGAWTAVARHLKAIQPR